jgi:uncharacterized protein
MVSEPPPGFEWDNPKAAENERKHGVTFDEAATVFDDPWAITEQDYASSANEGRGDRLSQSAR